GRSGRPGVSGFKGSDGRLGHVTLVQAANQLEDDVTRVSGSIEQLLSREFSFGVNRFARRSGALALLGPGSIVDNDYTAFTHRDIFRAILLWDTEDNYDDFQNLPAAMHVANMGVALSLDKDIIADVEQNVDGNLTVFKIKQALKTSDVRNIQFLVEGRLEDTQL